MCGSKFLYGFLASIVALIATLAVRPDLILPHKIHAAVSLKVRRSFHKLCNVQNDTFRRKKNAQKVMRINNLVVVSRDHPHISLLSIGFVDVFVKSACSLAT